jgi:hypothetical protein
MNATDFFEKNKGDRSFPRSSESFWTSIFALFLLHLSSNEHGIVGLDVWKPTQGQGHWYERKKERVPFLVKDLRFENLAVEPRTLLGVWPKVEFNINLTGISPDIILRLNDGPRRWRYVLIENKVATGASLGSNQCTAYPDLVRRLNEEGTKCELLLLKSIGISQAYRDALTLEARIEKYFGLLLWEDVFRTMQETHFSIPGIGVTTFQQFTEDAKNDCLNWEENHSNNS